MNCHCCSTTVHAKLPAVGGYFLLDDHHGRRIDAFSFGDRLMVIFFGFTHCAEVCPRELDKIDSALDQLGVWASRVQPLYITVDPERDSPSAMGEYLKSRPRFLGLTGSQPEIDATKKAFRVFGEKRLNTQAPGGYVVPHTTICYLAAPGGQVLEHFSDSVSADDLANRLRKHLVTSE